MSRRESETRPCAWRCHEALDAMGKASDRTIRSGINLGIQLMQRYPKFLRHERRPLPWNVTLTDPILDYLPAALAAGVG